jgi:Tfp pilus assembly protein PilV
MTRVRRRGERGSTIIEVMIATSVLIIAALGFAGTSQYAATSTGVGHRRTVATFLRTGLIDRLNVMPRSVLRQIAADHEDTWIVDACYDVQAQLIGTANGAYSTSFTCPATTFYRSWIRVVDNGAAGQEFATATNAWTIGLYVERVFPGCEAAQRDASLACVTADLLVTD